MYCLKIVVSQWIKSKMMMILSFVEKSDDSNKCNITNDAKTGSCNAIPNDVCSIYLAV